MTNPPMIDSTKVRAEMTALVDLISNPVFVDAMKNLKALPPAKRQEFGRKNLTIAALKQKGVKFPTGMRLTTRYFEPSKSGFVEWRPDGSSAISKSAKITILPDHSGSTVQWGGCACGGGMSFCGGAGGGT